MAEPVDAGAKILKNTKIIVYVEEAVEDLIVVSFTYGGKLYQGVLLDASKKSVPPLLISPEKTADVNDANGDRLFAVSQRHTYMQTGVENESPNNQLLANLRRPFKTFKNNSGCRPMRLRPRQVLCSKCRSICNENSENVQSQNSTENTNLKAVQQRLTPAEKKEKYRLKPRTETIASMPSSVPPVAGDVSPDLPYSSGMVLRKRRSVDLDKNEINEGDECEKKKKMDDLDLNLDLKPILLTTKTSPVIKISFGRHGQGTVLKIPARSSELETADVKPADDVVLSDVVSENCQIRDDSCAKAAKKALKKAKKEAVNNNHKTRHHKHKFKHKRRHRDVMLPFIAGQNGEQVTAQTVNPDEIFNWNDDDEEDVDADTSYNEIKKECLRQKLSISLKRLNAKAYTKSSPIGTSGNSTGGSNANSDQDNGPSQLNRDDSKDDNEKQLKPLMMRISTHSVDACAVGNGRTMAIGDIVWGKIHGFPWWPAKVLSITISQRDNGVLITQQAHVAWFGSSTTSLMPCSQLVPFLECFKTRYNKKKRGPYKEAIKQATLAAQQVLREMQTVNVVSSPQA